MAKELIYLAGPITGMPNFNLGAFADMAARLRAEGYAVCNPQELHAPSDDIAWEWYMKRDIPHVCRADRLVMLPGWENSRGATLEHYLAQMLKVEITYPHEVEELLAA